MPILETGRRSTTSASATSNGARYAGNVHWGAQIAATALLHIGQCQEKLGQAEARKAYESVVKEFADQTEIANGGSHMS